MAKHKVLVIEDNREHYIEIQVNLISDKVFSRLPFNEDEPEEQREKRRQYLRELHSDLDCKIPVEDCLSEKEIDFTNLLRQKGCLHEAVKKIDEIIEEHYRELRLIICDLKLCENNEAGISIIRHIRNDQILEDNPWYQKNIPILILTGLDGYPAVDAKSVGGWNCSLYKKIDVLDSFVKNEQQDSDKMGQQEIDSCQTLFRSFVDTLIAEFDQKYQYNINTKEFEIAISCTGVNNLLQHRTIPHKEFMDVFAKCLYSYYTEEKVYFYNDRYRITDFKKDINCIYGEECKYVIVIITNDYNTDSKNVTQQEWLAIQKRYEPLNYDGVFFVVIEKDVAIIDKIKQILGLKSDVPFIDFCEIVEEFYAIEKDDTTIERCKKNDTDCPVFLEYEKVTKKIKNKLEKSVIDVIKKKEENKGKRYP